MVFFMCPVILNVVTEEPVAGSGVAPVSSAGSH